MKIYLSIILSLFLYTPCLVAQDVKHCGSHQMEAAVRQLLPDQIPLILQNEALLNDATPSKSRGDKYIIPIVFHIIHNYGPENITDEQIHDAVRILNEDYQKKNPDTASVIP
ncbi:MAG TPA: hypothetical protein PLP14_04455, partial [Chitinophagaceae bacterium]|nr:hypothetical protein [Chitinophagaceae bacterium]